MRLFTIARKIGTEWSASEKSKLAKECINQLMAPLQGLSIQGSSVSVNGQAVLALCICASKEQANELVSLHNDPKLFQPCLYTHGKTRTQLDWVYNEFHRDVDKVKKGKHSNLQFSSYAMGCAFRKEKENDDGMAECAMQIKVVGELCDVILSGCPDDNTLICCIMALGLICDQRYTNYLEHECVEAALKILVRLDAVSYTHLDGADL